MTPNVGAITATGLKARLDRGEPLALLDVREEGERALCAIPAPPAVADLHVRLAEIPPRFEEVREAVAGRPLVVYCHLGMRSMVAARWLAARGLGPVLNLEGGIDAWSTDVDPALPRY